MSSSGRPHLVLFSQGPFLPNLDTTSKISDPGFSPVSDCPDPNPNSQEKLVPRIFQDYWELKEKGWEDSTMRDNAAILPLHVTWSV